MDQSTLDNFKNLFLNLKKNQMVSENALKSLDKTNRGDEVDLALEDREHQLAVKLKGRDNFFNKKVDAALKRIDEGTFGICLDCGADISLERLHARPTAHLCIDCKEEQEMTENHIRYDKKSHTHGKSLTLDNVVSLPKGDEIGKEKILKFNKQRISIGLKH